MKPFYLLLIVFLLTFSCSREKYPRTIQDFNDDWTFHLGDEANAFNASYDDSNWDPVNIPHDWSIEEGYQEEGTSCSTGFVPGGIGWYRKSFKLGDDDKDKQISITFNGVYNNATVWINGQSLGTRPYGYSSFTYDITNHLCFGNTKNVIAVKVNHSAYADSRWYTGSGIFRKITLTKTLPLHVAPLGVQITTPKVTKEFAEVNIKTQLEKSNSKLYDELTIRYSIIDSKDHTVVEEMHDANFKTLLDNTNLKIESPQLWSLDDPHQYTLEIKIFEKGVLIDNISQKFGVRSIKFDANKGFYLNGEPIKIKGVNLHHDAGALGAAVPKAVWQYRINKLKSIGVNAVRLSHNPHAVDLLDVCDEEGMLVMAEAFDEWNRPKEKSLVVSGDNAAPEWAFKGYSRHFDKWAERDLKDMIRRDFNHPSIIMWSIGNEIEWTFPAYSKTYTDVNGKGAAYYDQAPIYNPKIIKRALQQNTKKGDSLVLIAEKLSKWVKEIDESRPITCGSVYPSIGLASGYGKALDVYGFNYRAVEYDVAHKQYPNLNIIGSENWGTYSEWKNAKNRNFVSGIFLWTGFAYLGEAGPWPRKGLNISLFDYAGFKNPRGHFFECLWKEDPKVYLVTTPLADSEFTYNEKDGWTFEAKPWNTIRLWEWYRVFEKWKYPENEPIVVQAYTNCEEAELFLDEVSLGKQKLSDVSETDNILKWLVPYSPGKLKVVGYNKGVEVTEYGLATTNDTISKIALRTNKGILKDNGYDVAVVDVELLDKDGQLITDNDVEITFDISGEYKAISVDNGWENFVGLHKTNKITTHNGKAVAFIQSSNERGSIDVEVTYGEITSNSLEIKVK